AKWPAPDRRRVSRRPEALRSGAGWSQGRAPGGDGAPADGVHGRQQGGCDQQQGTPRLGNERQGGLARQGMNLGRRVLRVEEDGVIAGAEVDDAGNGAVGHAIGLAAGLGVGHDTGDQIEQIELDDVRIAAESGQRPDQQVVVLDAGIGCRQLESAGERYYAEVGSVGDQEISRATVYQEVQREEQVADGQLGSGQAGGIVGWRNTGEGRGDTQQVIAANLDDIERVAVGGDMAGGPVAGYLGLQSGGGAAEQWVGESAGSGKGASKGIVVAT